MLRQSAEIYRSGQHNGSGIASLAELPDGPPDLAQSTDESRVLENTKAERACCNLF